VDVGTATAAHVRAVRRAPVAVNSTIVLAEAGVRDRTRAITHGSASHVATADSSHLLAHTPPLIGCGTSRH
jgi:hypothetical protein